MVITITSTTGWGLKITAHTFYGQKSINYILSILTNTFDHERLTLSAGDNKILFRTFLIDVLRDLHAFLGGYCLF